MGRFERLMGDLEGRKKEEYEFSPEFEKVIKAIEDWKDLREKKGCEVFFVAAFTSYNPKSTNALDGDFGIRYYGNSKLCKAQIEFLAKRLKERGGKNEHQMLSKFWRNL